MRSTEDPFWPKVRRILRNHGAYPENLKLLRGSTDDYAVWRFTNNVWGYVYVYGPHTGEVMYFNTHTGEHEDFNS